MLRTLRRPQLFIFIAFVFIFLGLPAPSLPAANGLADIESLIEGGARGLALRLIDESQPPADQQQAWILWERLRFKLYTAQGNWVAIFRRVDRLPKGLPVEFARWAETQAAQAALQVGDAPRARAYLRSLIWQADGDYDQVPRWRRLVIRSYLLEGNVEDAEIALLRYENDYNATGDAWQLLHAKVLLRARRYKSAFSMLSGIQTDEARLLLLYAALHAGIYQTQVIIERTEKFVQRPRVQAQLKRKAWVLAAQAAARRNDYGQRVAALESALAGDPLMEQVDPFLTLRADDLWRAYEALAEFVGNSERLLVGNDADWLKKAEGLKDKDVHTTRAIYAFLASHGQVAIVREIAHQRLTDSLFDNGQGTVARALYSQSQRFGSLAEVPDAVRYRLANQALLTHDVRMAARLMKGLKQPPAGVDVDQWILRRARTLVYAGDTRPAIRLLEKLLADRDSLEVDLAKRTIQVLFDLQAVREHAKAYALLKLVFDLVDQDGIRRELLYWMAESKAALGEHEKAAELYLRSAVYGRAKSGDPWGQSARFQAAESLSRAGLVEDARNTYRQLLRHTTDPKRRALIERNLQQLWLVENKPTKQ